MGSILRTARRVSLLLLLFAAGPAARAAAPPRVDFDRQIRPLLSDNCYACHGPDDKARKAKLRLDRKQDALEHGNVIVPGRAAKSELFERVTSQDPKTRMPPPRTGKRLTAQQID